MAMGEDATGAAWIGRRFLPALAFCALAGAALGIFRGKVSFLAGVGGMIAGGAAGYAAGRLGRGDPDRLWTFGQRIWFALSGALVYGTAQLLTAAALRAGPGDSLFYWIGEMLGGFEREAFFSLGQTGGAILHTYRGTLTGGWWLFFNLLDGLLFAFLFLVSCGMGYFPSEPEEEDEESEEEEAEEEEETEDREETFEGFASDRRGIPWAPGDPAAPSGEASRKGPGGRP